MAAPGSRMMVCVFDTEERAKQAAVTLVGDGYHDHQIVIIAGGDGVGVADRLVTYGVATELAAYYATEVQAGRPLVVVQCRPDDTGEARTALSRHGGSVRVPPEIREGRV